MVFRKMRRKKQALSQQETADILHWGTSGVLALMGGNRKISGQICAGRYHRQP